MMPDTPPSSSLPADPAAASATTRRQFDGGLSDKPPAIHAAPARRGTMSVEALEAFMDASSVALDLPIDPAHRPGVLRYLGIAAAMARTLEQFPLSERVEPAVRFEPVSPGSRAAKTHATGVA